MYARPLLDLLLPTACAGCGRWDTPLCEACGNLARTHPRPHVLEEVGSPAVAALSLGKYDGPLRRVILTAKHDSGARLDNWLYHCGITLGAAAVERLDWAGSAQVCVVPAPSKLRRRWQGMMVTPQVARAVAQTLRAMGVQAQMREVLALRVGQRTQSGRDAQTRRRGRHGAMFLRTPVGQRQAIVVDDVITTGATIRECVRVLENSGVQVPLVLSLAVVKKPQLMG
ncbi:competence protein ComF [Gleimia hominis]|uniref:Competence protein ComF n=1 Tax=Gleimia hominis TaxID=595468 RepID=A0ABU3IAD4_9ACTO|nr:competence protein ComF [Gleimia hominis]MDT3767344.1 competence protein ComF [Gleimia hominis]